VKESAGYKKIQIIKKIANKDKTIKFNVKTKDLPHTLSNAAKESLEYNRYDNIVEIKAGEKEA
jgi:hypothetical protein